MNADKPHRAKNAPKIVVKLNHEAVKKPSPSTRNRIPNSKINGLHFPHKCIPHAHTDSIFAIVYPSFSYNAFLKSAELKLINRIGYKNKAFK